MFLDPKRTIKANVRKRNSIFPGLGTTYRISLSDDGLSPQEIQKIEFNKFADKAVDEVTTMIGCFERSEKKSKSPNSNEPLHYEKLDNEFLRLTVSFFQIIQEIRYSGDTSQQAKNRITTSLFGITRWLDNKYPSWNKERAEVEKNSKEIEKRVKKEFKAKRFYKTKFAILAISTFFIPFIFCWFSLQKKYPKWFKVISFLWAIFFAILVYRAPKT
ncbi:hypothetical protein JEP40_18500 [Proteus vulgaris]|uniref:hypothetical protein n=1 Tax=Proteus vulgaris TaxID=585 RepID=UPI0018E4A07E|nr:hypothetical protein [Proteus vulgaris]MBI6531101.1 hypothetical protein [Proteus vulgaris]